jgi:hypothetical protein
MATRTKDIQGHERLLSECRRWSPLVSEQKRRRIGRGR